ncbi:MAG: PorT family protein [Dysgonamonadaceae bacterium]|jgi:hypothetical protein|nr:PorT family protein [Dysgonamonadaceae bacterium]
MKKTKWIATLGLLYALSSLQAQEILTTPIRMRIGLTGGFTSFQGSTNKPQQVREYNSDLNYYAWDSEFSKQQAELSRLGVQIEYFILDNRFGLTAGLHFAQMTTDFAPTSSYFYWQMPSNGLITNYIRVRDIVQTKQYIGIPMEIKWLMSKLNRTTMPYLKVGCTVDYCLNTKTSIGFHDAAMEKYTGEITNQLQKTSPFFVSIYPAFGLRFGKEEAASRWNPWLNLELRLGETVLSENMSSFTKNNISGFGGQISLQIPLK